ncbi:type VII secretion integral membrane protein EccD [Nocardia ignorata]|uniref:type VII secretion integral membrane protein EccD n=1 Tax=Nocardia ignorata TaxID=145285 RepID=UPI0036279A87
MTAQSSGGVGTTEPELCRVSVIGGNTQLDVGLPANVPIIAFIDDLVALIESRDPQQPDQEDGAAPLEARHHTLARLGRDPLRPNQTLAEAEVFDGELLVLRSVASAESPALFDDVIDAVSRLTAEVFHGWSAASARMVGLVVATVAIIAGLGLSALTRGHGADLIAPIMLAGAAIGSLGAAVIAVRKLGAEFVGAMLVLYTLLLVFGTGALIVPGALGAPHVLLGCTATFVAAIGCYRLARVGTTMIAATATLCALGAVAAAVRLFWEPGLDAIAAGLVVGATLLFSAAARLAAGFAKLPIPPVPTAGAAIDPADHEPRPTIEGIGAIGATVLPSAAGLGLRARYANNFQTGIVGAAAFVAAAAAVVAADPFGAAGRPGIALAVVTATILCLRGRSFADLAQACAMITAGCLSFIALIVALALGDPEMLVTSVGLLLLFAIGSVVFGVLGPHAEATPPTQRAIEIFEYILIISMVPLVVWIMDVYSIARNL